MTRAIAFYLPQFQPIPENDSWWGKGFTEWTNTAKALPLFDGHYQPHIPADLGFYDLRLPESRNAQAKLAKQYGIEAFCYYHYWFGGRRILEKTFDEVLESGKPDFPFCLCWANQSWTGIWHNAPGRMLIEQTYPGDDDYRQHFDWLLRAFHDPRYVKIEGRPVFLVFDPESLPDSRRVCELWQDLAEKGGLPGLHVLGVRHGLSAVNPHKYGFDGAVDMRMPLFSKDWLIGQQECQILDHRQVTVDEVAEAQSGVTHYPCIGPSWDNSPRLGRRGLVYTNSDPDLFRETVRRAVSVLGDKPPERQLLFLKSWNEWAEGNHLEPDLRFGHGWLEALRQGMVVDEAASSI